MFTPEQKKDLAEKARRIAASCLEFSDALDDENENNQLIALFHFIALAERSNMLSIDIRRMLEKINNEREL